MNHRKVGTITKLAQCRVCIIVMPKRVYILIVDYLYCMLI